MLGIDIKTPQMCLFLFWNSGWYNNMQLLGIDGKTPQIVIVLETNDKTVNQNKLR